jgi:O-antigen/teichoic acid export membrane protein
MRRYGGSAGWLMLDRIVRIGLGLTVSVLVARYLGPHDFGLLSFAVSFVSLLSVATTLGLDNILARELTLRTSVDDARRVIRVAVAMRLCGATLVVAVLGVVLAVSDWQAEAHPLILIIACATIPQAAGSVEAYFLARVQGARIAIPRVLSVLAASAAKLALVWFGLPVVWFAACALLEATLAAGMLWRLYRVHLGGAQRPEPLDPALGLGLLKESWPLMLSVLATSVYMRIDEVMLLQMAGAEAVGHYGVAVTLSEGWYFVPVTICTTLFPALVRARAAGPVQYRDRLQRLYDLMVWLGLAVALPLTFLSGPLIGWLYGPAYAPAGEVLAIHIWAGLLVSLGLASGRWLIAEGFVRFAFYRSVLGAIVNVALNLVLIPRAGVVGAAWATVIAYGTASCLSLLLFERTRPQLVMQLKALLLPGSLLRLARTFRRAPASA